MKTEIRGNGWDTADLDVGIETMQCQVCGANMDVEERIGPTGFGEAMARREHRHKVFRCSERHEDWHTKAFRIKEEASKTHSDKLKTLLMSEFEEILLLNCN